jgi:hypothetical protein
VSSSHTVGECICHAPSNAMPYWHQDECPVRKASCADCDGQGGRWVTASCECCTDYVECDYCNHTGLAPLSDEEQSHGR